jgi:rhamnose transport system substrate-binding protein
MKLLIVALAAEVALFAAIAPYFLTVGNLAEITRSSVELGLLALALTPIIVSGGIDLSVGSMMGLAAVVFGAAAARGSVVIAAALALLVGVGGGGLNAVAVARLGIPPLIATLATLSLFRGIAEGLTHGAVNYSGFPPAFLFLGQGYLGGVIPAQLPLFLLALAGYAILLHRSIVGRAWYAIGFSPAGARHAGLPVSKRLALAYMLSGLTASLAAIVYVAHLGQAKADAGTGYELDAITAVVLGGASISGGRGTIWGTLVGLAALATLQNGLRLAALPSELTGVITGVLLVTTIAFGKLATPKLPGVAKARGLATPKLDGVAEERGLVTPKLAGIAEERRRMKNSQVAVICAAILASAILVSGTNVWLVRSLQPGQLATPKLGGVAGERRRVTIAMMPKAKGDPYFVSCRAGAEEAARELGVELIWDGPTSLDASKQNEVVENWITRKVDVIAVSVENRAGISTVLRKAQQRGIRVITWDADAEPDARDFFVNQATPEGIGTTLTDEAARLLDGRGDFAIITGALSAANQNEWMVHIRKRLAEKYPGVKLVTVRPSDDDRDKAFAETQTVLRANPTVRLIMAISAPAVPGAAEAVRQAGRTGVSVIGLSLPNLNKPYVHAGVVQTVVLWNTRDLGYLTVYAGSRLANGALASGARSLEAGRLGSLEIRGRDIILGAPLLITKANIDTFDF